MTDLELIEQAQALILFGAGQTRCMTALIGQFKIDPKRADYISDMAVHLLDLEFTNDLRT